MNEFSDDNASQQPEDIDSLKSKLDAETQRAGRYETRLKNEIIERTLERMATRAGAYSPAQIVSVLMPRSKAIQATDANGQPTDDYEVITELGTGEAVSPRLVIERMRESDPNFFFTKDQIHGDTGGHANETPAKRRARLAKNPDEYRRVRRESPESIGLRPRRHGAGR